MALKFFSEAIPLLKVDRFKGILHHNKIHRMVNDHLGTSDLPTHPHCAGVTRIEGSSPAHTLKMHITRIKLNFVILLTVLMISKEAYTNVINT